MANSLGTLTVYIRASLDKTSFASIKTEIDKLSKELSKAFGSTEKNVMKELSKLQTTLDKFDIFNTKGLKKDSKAFNKIIQNTTSGLNKKFKTHKIEAPLMTDKQRKAAEAASKDIKASLLKPFEAKDYEKAILNPAKAFEKYGNIIKNESSKITTPFDAKDFARRTKDIEKLASKHTRELLTGTKSRVEQQRIIEEEVGPKPKKPEFLTLFEDAQRKLPSISNDFKKKLGEFDTTTLFTPAKTSDIPSIMAQGFKSIGGKTFFAPTKKIAEGWAKKQGMDAIVSMDVFREDILRWAEKDPKQAEKYFNNISGVLDKTKRKFTIADKDIRKTSLDLVENIKEVGGKDLFLEIPGIKKRAWRKPIEKMKPDEKYIERASTLDPKMIKKYEQGIKSFEQKNTDYEKVLKEKGFYEKEAVKKPPPKDYSMKDVKQEYEENRKDLIKSDLKYRKSWDELSKKEKKGIFNTYNKKYIAYQKAIKDSSGKITEAEKEGASLVAGAEDTSGVSMINAAKDATKNTSKVMADLTKDKTETIQDSYIKIGRFKLPRGLTWGKDSELTEELKKRGITDKKTIKKYTDEYRKNYASYFSDASKDVQKATPIVDAKKMKTDSEFLNKYYGIDIKNIKKLGKKLKDPYSDLKKFGKQFKAEDIDYIKPLKEFDKTYERKPVNVTPIESIITDVKKMGGNLNKEIQEFGKGIGVNIQGITSKAGEYRNSISGFFSNIFTKRVDIKKIGQPFIEGIKAISGEEEQVAKDTKKQATYIDKAQPPPIISPESFKANTKIILDNAKVFSNNLNTALTSGMDYKKQLKAFKKFDPLAFYPTPKEAETKAKEFQTLFQQVYPDMKKVPSFKILGPMRKGWRADWGDLKDVTDAGVSDINKKFGEFIGTTEDVSSQIKNFKRDWAGFLPPGQEWKENWKMMEDGSVKATMTMGKSFGGFRKNLLSLEAFFGKIIHYITFSIGVQLVMGIKKGFDTLKQTFTDFEKSITDAVAISGYVGSAFDKAREKAADFARELSKKTIFSSNEIAKAFYDVASAGYDITKMTDKELLPILNYATATQSNLADATQSVLSTLKAFKMEFSDASKVVDIFTKAITTSFLTMEKLKEGMKYVGPIAGELGLSLEETAAAMSVLADRGMEGGQSGQRLAMILTTLLDPSDKAKDMLEALGLTLSDINPLTRSFVDILYTLREAGFSTSEATEMFRTRTAGAAATLVNNADAVATTINAYRQAEGATMAVAKAQEDTLWAALKKTTNELVAISTTAGQDMKPIFISLAQVMTDILVPITRVFGGVLKFLGDNLDTISTSLKILLPLLLTYLTLSKLIIPLTTKIIGVYKKVRVFLAALNAQYALKLARLKAVNTMTAIGNANTVTSTINISAQTGALTAQNTVLGAQTGLLAVLQAAWAGLQAIWATAGGPLFLMTALIGGIISSLVILTNIFKKSAEDITSARDKIIDSFAREKMAMDDSTNTLLNYFDALEDTGDQLFKFRDIASKGNKDIMLAILGEFGKDPDKYQKNIKLFFESFESHFSNISTIAKESEGDINKFIEIISKPAHQMHTLTDVHNIQIFMDAIKASKAPIKEMIDNFRDFIAIQIGLSDEYITLQDAMENTKEAYKDEITLQYALYIAEGRTISVLSDDKNITEILTEAKKKYNEILQETGDSVKTVAILENEYVEAQNARIESSDDYLSSINKMLTSIRSFNQDLNIQKITIGENGEEIEEIVKGGNLDEWISRLEDWHKASLDIQDSDSERIRLGDRQKDLILDLSQAIAIYGADSKQASEIQEDLNETTKDLLKLGIDRAKSVDEETKLSNLYISALNDEVIDEEKLGETEKVLLQISNSLIKSRYEFLDAEKEAAKWEAKRLILERSRTEFLINTTDAYKKYLEAQEKVFEIEEKLYKLRHGEDEQMEDIFEKLAEQGLLNEDIIDAYMRLEIAQGGVLELNKSFADAYGDLTAEQRAVVDGFLTEEKTLDDLYDAGISNVNIFIRYKDALDELNDATTDFEDIIGPTVSGLINIGAASTDLASAYYEWADNTAEINSLNYDLIQANLTLTNTFDNLIRNTTLLAKSMITNEIGSSNLVEIYDNLLIEMGLFDESSATQINILNTLNGLYGTSSKSLSDFTEGELVLAATVLQAAKAWGIYEDGMALSDIANKLGLKSFDSLSSSADITWDSIDDMGDVLGKVASTTADLSVAIDKLTLSLDTMFSLTTAESFILALKTNFTEFITGLGEGNDTLLNFSALMERFPDFKLDQDITVTWNENDWKTFLGILNNAPDEIKSLIGEKIGLDIDTLWTSDNGATTLENALEKKPQDIATLGNIIKASPLYIDINTRWDNMPWDKFYTDFYSTNEDTRGIVDKFFTENAIDIPVDKEKFENSMKSLGPSQMADLRSRLLAETPAEVLIKADEEFWKDDFNTTINKMQLYLNEHPLTIKTQMEETKVKPKRTVGILGAFSLQNLWDILTGGEDEIQIDWSRIVGKGGIFGLQKGLEMTKGPTSALIGEAGPEAVVPLSGKNKKYGEQILKEILPKYFPHLTAMQTGGVAGYNEFGIPIMNKNTEDILSVLKNILDSLSTDFIGRFKSIIYGMPITTPAVPKVGVSTPIGGDATATVPTAGGIESINVRQGGKVITVNIGAVGFASATENFINKLQDFVSQLVTSLQNAITIITNQIDQSVVIFRGAIDISKTTIETAADNFKIIINDAAKVFKTAVEDVTPIKVIHTFKYLKAGEHQKGGIYNKPTMGVFGEAGAEALIPLEGANKRYGEKLLQMIIPSYYPKLALQAGGLFTGKGGSPISNTETNEENFNILGPVYVTAPDTESFSKDLKYRYRMSK